jgi:dolichol-phosphate mannosyltransferase
MRPTFSVVVPLFDECESLPELHERLSRVLRGLDQPYEFIYVNDGSRDGTDLQLDDLARTDPAVLVVHLSRNFGHQAAISAGLDQARGRAVIVMDGDLQDPPELIPRLIATWRTGAQVVYAIRERRRASWAMRLAYHMFYRIQRSVSELEMPLDAGDFCLMDRQVVRAIRALPERQRYVRGLRSFVGFRQASVRYDRPARVAGRSKYSFAKLMKLAMDGLVGFSHLPLRIVTCLGFLSAVLAIGLTIWVMADALFQHTAPRGWASLACLGLFLGAVQLVGLGIIGEYVGRIFLETKGRPTYIVARRTAQRLISWSSRHHTRSNGELRADHPSAAHSVAPPRHSTSSIADPSVPSTV